MGGATQLQRVQSTSSFCGCCLDIQAAVQHKNNSNIGTAKVVADKLTSFSRTQFDS